MFRNFKEIESYVLDKGIKKRIVLMNAHDSHSLPAVVDAKRKGVLTAALIGDSPVIEKMLSEMDEPQSDYEIIHNTDSASCAKMAISLIKAGQADYPMKGLMQTTDFMRAILDKENGLVPPGGLLSQATIVENPEENRLFFVTDCAINIAPNFAQKKLIIENAVGLASALGYENPKVAAISAIEIANPKIPSTMDAKALQEANERGEIRGCVIAGPLALDNAVSRESARHKDISGPIAGDADILLMPDLAAGNIFTKSLTFYAKMNSAGTILGASCPIIGTSRTDTPSNKYLAILIGLACVGMANA